MKKLATVGLASIMLVGMLSATMAADKPKTAVIVAPPPPPIVQPFHHHAILWCVGGLIVTAVVHNPVPAIVGCTIGAVKLVHGV